MTKPGIEVAICSHNGSARLPAVLQALAAQTLPSRSWCILLVDNASTDDTAASAHRAWSRPDVTLRVVSEPRPGLRFARERALAEAARALICFCDDDNLLAPDYLEQAIDLMEQLPLAGALGGKGEAVGESPLPEWFAGAARGYAVGPQADSDGEVSVSRAALYGAGMILRRSAWDQLASSGFEPRLMDRVGTRLNSGEDNEICLMLSIMGWQIHYSHRLTFRHMIPARRLEEAYCRSLYRGFGEALIVLGAYRDFLLGRASQSAWRRCASLRLAQSWIARASDFLRSASRAPLTASTLKREILREIAAGFAGECRSNYRGRRLFALYGDIAAWLAAARKVPIEAQQPLARIEDRETVK